MRHMKIYENFNNFEAKIGDYVICQRLPGDLGYADIVVKNFLENNVGQIIKIDESSILRYLIRYNNLTSRVKKYCSFYEDSNHELQKNAIWFKPKSIIKFSQDKNKLEDYICATKYNL